MEKESLEKKNVAIAKKVLNMKKIALTSAIGLLVTTALTLTLIEQSHGEKVESAQETETPEPPMINFKGAMSEDTYLQESSFDMQEDARAWGRPVRYSFRLAERLLAPESALAAEDDAWQTSAPQQLLTEGAKLLALFDMPDYLPDDWDPGSYSSLREDGASLWLSSSGDWYYSGPTSLWPTWDCPPYEKIEAESGVLGDVIPSWTSEDCAEPTPPDNILTLQETEKAARAAFATLGLLNIVESEGRQDEWGVMFEGQIALPGSDLGSGLRVNWGYAGGEQVAYASGTFATLEKLGTYPLATLQDALERYQAEMDSWHEGSPDWDDSDYSDKTQEQRENESAGSAAGSTEDPLAAPGTTDSEDMPVAITPAPGTPELDWTFEEIELTIVDAKVVISPVWIEGGTMLLLPHYLLTDEQGGWWYVLAVEEKYLAR